MRSADEMEGSAPDRETAPRRVSQRGSRGRQGDEAVRGSTATFGDPAEVRYHHQTEGDRTSGNVITADRHYHPLIISLANTGEVLSLGNRSGNRPSHEGATAQLDLTILLCRQAGFRRIYLRGDTDFTQTQQLDAWDAEGVAFLFGIDAMPNLKALAADLPASAWSALPRPPQYVAKGKRRKRPANLKDQIVRQRE